jgi:hypothetical protein
MRTIRIFEHISLNGTLAAVLSVISLFAEVSIPLAVSAGAAPELQGMVGNWSCVDRDSDGVVARFTSRDNIYVTGCGLIRHLQRSRDMRPSRRSPFLVETWLVGVGSSLPSPRPANTGCDQARRTTSTSRNGWMLTLRTALQRSSGCRSLDDVGRSG